MDKFWAIIWLLIFMGVFLGLWAMFGVATGSLGVLLGWIPAYVICWIFGRFVLVIID